MSSGSLLRSSTPSSALLLRHSLLHHLAHQEAPTRHLCRSFPRRRGCRRRAPGSMSRGLDCMGPLDLGKESDMLSMRRDRRRRLRLLSSGNGAKTSGRRCGESCALSDRQASVLTEITQYKVRKPSFPAVSARTSSLPCSRSAQGVGRVSSCKRARVLHQVRESTCR